MKYAKIVYMAYFSALLGCSVEKSPQLPQLLSPLEQQVSEEVIGKPVMWSPLVDIYIKEKDGKLKKVVLIEPEPR